MELIAVAHYEGYKYNCRFKDGKDANPCSGYPYIANYQKWDWMKQYGLLKIALFCSLPLKHLALATIRRQLG